MTVCVEYGDGKRIHVAECYDGVIYRIAKCNLRLISFKKTDGGKVAIPVDEINRVTEMI